MDTQRSYKVLVIKIGSSTLIDESGAFVSEYVTQLADQIHALSEQNWRVIIVTSGAIACGMGVLGLRTRPTDIPKLQACASVGQGALASDYQCAFGEHGLTTSLVLLTRHDTKNRHAYLHARNALCTLLDYGVVPIINENDTIAVDEIKFGDNDTLAALVSCLVKADMCILGTDIDGLYTKNPRVHPDAERLSIVTSITPEILASAQGAGSKVGTGGMITKLKAARALMAARIPLVICHAHEPEMLVRAVRGEDMGTRFVSDGAGHEITNYKLWIALGDAAHGSVVVDAGAAAALISRGSSLLCVGITEVNGCFDAGDIIDVLNPEGALIARGKVNASADEVILGRGRSQAALAANRLLAPLAEKPIIHRDEMVVFA